jgi:hypothetical protein
MGAAEILLQSEQHHTRAKAAGPAISALYAGVVAGACGSSPVAPAKNACQSVYVVVRIDAGRPHLVVLNWALTRVCRSCSGADAERAEIGVEQRLSGRGPSSH